MVSISVEVFILFLSFLLTISIEVSSIVQKWREHPPSSYSLKIHNFSQFENSTASSDHKYESRPFSSGGYNWRLIVYPRGNEKENGKGFISMYVEIDRSSVISKLKTEVIAEIRFFIYNKKENNYFTIQDAQVKRFNALRPVWGLVKVLPSDAFRNPNNGYVFEGGQCEFGVDVIVSSPFTNWEIISFDEKLFSPKFSWTINKFSKLKEDVQTSNNFTMGGRRWFLKLYPKGNTKADGRWLSIFLYLADSDKPKADEKIFTKAHLRVLDPFGSNHVSRQSNKWRNEYTLGWGWNHFLSLDQLRQAYLDKHGSLQVEIEFEVVSTTEYSPMI